MKKISLILFIIFTITSLAYAVENYFFTNFSTGVLTRKLDARIDFEKFFNGARQAENVFIYPQGGVCKRAGTYYVTGVSNSTENAILVPFEYSTQQAYVLEFGNNYIRFYRDNGQILGNADVPYEVTTTYGESELNELKFAQSADYLYIAHPAHAPAKLTRSGHTSWTLSDITFSPPMTGDLVFYPDSVVTPFAATGSDVIFEAGASTFLAGDVNRQIRQVGTGSSIAVITGYIDDTSVTCEIITDFSGTTPFGNTAKNSWYLLGTPTGSLDPDVANPKGGIATLTNTLAAFRTGDTGHYLYINGGLIKTTSYVSSTVITGEILDILDDADADTAWSLEEPIWTSDNGYPSTVEFFEERLIWAGTSTYPQTLWLSKTGDYENLTTGADNDDAISVTISSSKVNTIRWINTGQALNIGTIGSEWTLGAMSTTDAISPSNVRIKQHTTHGVANVVPVRVGRDLLFVQRSGKKIRQFGYNWEVDGYTSEDLTILAENLFSGTTILGMAYQQEPYNIVWVVTSDGNLMGLTYIKDQKIWAWHKHTTDGDFESIAVISNDNGNDELWAIVARSISGTTYRYVEYFKDIEQDTLANSFYIDCGLSYSGSGTTYVTGAGHLTGESVAVLADGVYLGEMAVTGGTVTLGTTATSVHLGLPYTATLETVDLPPGTGIIRRIPEINIRFYKTAQAKYGSSSSDLDSIDFTRTGTTPYTGDKELPYPGGWSQSQTIYVTSDEPFPFSISGILVKYE